MCALTSKFGNKPLWAMLRLGQRVYSSMFVGESSRLTVCSDQFVCGRLCALLCMCVGYCMFCSVCVWSLYALLCMCVEFVWFDLYVWVGGSVPCSVCV